MIKMASLLLSRADIRQTGTGRSHKQKLEVYDINGDTQIVNEVKRSALAPYKKTFPPTTPQLIQQAKLASH